jgi:hypothetical protein
MAYTTITDPSAQFQTALYSGNGGGTNNVVNDGNSNLQPDFVWVKERSSTSSHALTNSNVGAGYILSSNNTNDQSSASAFTSFDSDGFTVGSDGKTNENGQTYVGWQWKAAGGTTSTNYSGTINSTVQANTTAGFSIVTYTGTGSNATIGHGLGVVPEMIIVKVRSAVDPWSVYHASNTSSPETDYLVLDSTAATADHSNRWNDTAPTSTLISLGASGTVNGNGLTYIAYCFASIKGYSSFGSYIGNGSNDGAYIYTGFKPRFIMLKGSSNVSSWNMYDTKRDPINRASQQIKANEGNAEASTGAMDFLSNGIKMRTSDNDFNGAGNPYVYMTFAENPFVATNGVPATAK